MKQLVVISGKGGTGKTSMTAAFAALAENKIMVDCDVDAADLHLLLKPQQTQTFDYFGGKDVIINNSGCVKCDKCLMHCRFDAITFDGSNYNINPFLCEGCGVCHYICQANTITISPKLAGKWYQSETDYGSFIHARLEPGEETSGKLITLMRQHAKQLAEQQQNDLIIIDGSPGIGCPVIASLTGVDVVMIVTEATVSGLHDLKRILQLVNHFKLKSYVCINKCDLNTEMAVIIEQESKAMGSSVIEKIPYNTDFYDAQLQGKSIIEYTDSEITTVIKQMWNTLKEQLKD